MSQKRRDCHEGRISRRDFVIAGGGAVTATVFSLRYGIRTVEAKSSNPKEVKIVEFSDAGQREDAVTVPVIVKTDAE
jgi:hypothetical protein